MDSSTSHPPPEQSSPNDSTNRNISVQALGDSMAHKRAVHLPLEIGFEICSLLTNKEDLKNVRLVSRMFKSAAASTLFRNIRLSTMRPSPNSINIIESDELCKYVRKVTYTHDPELEVGDATGFQIVDLSNPQEVWNYNGWKSERPSFSQSYNAVKARFAKLENITEVVYRAIKPGGQILHQHSNPCWSFVRAALSCSPTLKSLRMIGFDEWNWLAAFKDFTDSEKECLRGLRHLTVNISPQVGETTSKLFDGTPKLESLEIIGRWLDADYRQGPVLIDSRLPFLVSLTIVGAGIDERNFQRFLVSVAPTLRSLTLKNLSIKGDERNTDLEFDRRCPWTSMFYFLGAKMQLDKISLEGVFLSSNGRHRAWFAGPWLMPRDPFSMYCRVEQYITKRSSFPLPAPDIDHRGLDYKYVSDGSFETRISHKMLLWYLRLWNYNV